MEDTPTTTSAIYAVSRSRGKQPGEPALKAKLRERRKAKGQARSSDESEPEDEMEPDSVILHQLFNRKVILQADKTVVKVGKRITLGEGEALKIAVSAGIPAPSVRDTCTTSDGEVRITMDYIPGESLEKLWPDMSVDQKKDIAQQIRQIVEKMRSITPPTDFIGACDGTEIRDTRVHFTYHSLPCRDEKAFNEFLLTALYEPTPPLLREAFSRRLRTDHRVVFSHCDLAPRNILVQDGKIQGLVDWEDAGWYPEYWEYVKFFQRNFDKDFRRYAVDIFPEVYHDELVDYTAISHWQNS
ncbi:hypothetical protein FPSE_02923 [Fusarium pseudograminearum CS3096]|uniref:Aminoglycoside phosphotransferase domain-containing protein n=1 Tax=Fusarium pseudograminearum (strain CS3096) TaxID=1028729 RepID=K3W228_FUSPC|nr:hypothetical protein FPSE_02923 [Fusarium pseudograminearum CS3096]EKJ76925.1 hypothetical protein FPSE_02923 [Fusarium pseudograminearum CS3096]